MKTSTLLRRAIFTGLLLLAAIALSVHAQEVAADAPPAPPVPPHGPGVPAQPASGPTAPFAATVYELHMPADQIGRLDIDALTKSAATAQGFDKALAALGAAHISYLVNESVQLADDTIKIVAETPFITNSQTTNTGGVINGISYTNIGAIFSISGKMKGPAQVDLNLKVQVSGITYVGVALSDKVNAPSFRIAEMARKGPVQTGQPFVLISADGASPDADGKAVVVVARVTLGTPE